VPYQEDTELTEPDQTEVKLSKNQNKLVNLVQLIERPWQWNSASEESRPNWENFDYLMCRTLNKWITVYQASKWDENRYVKIGNNWSVDLKEMI
jgi:hypothetical protein